MPPPHRRLADRGDDGGRLQAVERGLEALVVPIAGVSTDDAQELVRR